MKQSQLKQLIKEVIKEMTGVKVDPKAIEAINTFQAEIDSLKATHPKLSFGYIGNVWSDPRYQPQDDRAWYVWNGREKWGGYETKDVPEMLAKWQAAKERFLKGGAVNEMMGDPTTKLPDVKRKIFDTKVAKRLISNGFKLAVSIFRSKQNNELYLQIRVGPGPNVKGYESRWTDYLTDFIDELEHLGFDYVERDETEKPGAYILFSFGSQRVLPFKEEESPFGLNRRGRRDLSQKLANYDDTKDAQVAMSAGMDFLKKSNPSAAYKLSSEKSRQDLLKQLAKK